MPRLRWASVLGLLLALGCRGKSADQSPATAIVPAEELPGTDVLPHTSGRIVPGRNYVYCSTFQLAWSELEQSVLKEPLVLKDSPPLAALLSRGPKLSAQDLPTDGYVARAGLVRDGVVQQIREEMAARFPGAEFSLPESADAQLIVAYAYQARHLRPSRHLPRHRAIARPLGAVAANGLALSTR